MNGAENKVDSKNSDDGNTISPRNDLVDSKNSDDGNTVSPRNDLITTAVNFLQNSKVRNSPLAQKKAFLIHKGLTNEEIDIAIEKSGTLEQLQRIEQEKNLVIPSTYRQQYSNWSKWREMWSSVVILGATLFGAYKLYKHYVEPKVFGKPSKSKEEIEIWTQLAELNMSLSNLKQNVINMQESLVEQHHHLKQIKENSEKPIEDLSLTEIKTEITSIKALLLSRHQFPTSRISNPSIPSWQMVESDSQNEVTSMSISEVEPSGLCSIITLSSENNTSIINDNIETEGREKESLLEGGC